MYCTLLITMSSARLKKLQLNVNTQKSKHECTIINTSLTDKHMFFAPPFQIPSLRMICRGIQARRTLIHPKDLPPLTIKEALEVYYSLKRSDKSLQMEQRWRYLADRFVFQNFGSPSAFLQACSAMLKTVNHFEEKVKSAKRNPALMRRWNDKLNVLLAAPFHDTLSLSAVAASKFRGYEFPLRDRDEVGVVCMNCPNAGCGGCATSRVLVKTEVKTEVKRPVIKPRLLQKQRPPHPPPPTTTTEAAILRGLVLLVVVVAPAPRSHPPGHHRHQGQSWREAAGISQQLGAVVVVVVVWRRHPQPEDLLRHHRVVEEQGGHEEGVLAGGQAAGVQEARFPQRGAGLLQGARGASLG